MIAKNDTDLQEACETLLQLSANDTIREQCDARRAYYARERHHKQVEQALADAQQKNSALIAEIAELKALLAKQSST